jgi:hypothetical protein
LSFDAKSFASIVLDQNLDAESFSSIFKWNLHAVV